MVVEVLEYEYHVKCIKSARGKHYAEILMSFGDRIGWCENNCKDRFNATNIHFLQDCNSYTVTFKFMSEADAVAFKLMWT